MPFSSQGQGRAQTSSRKQQYEGPGCLHHGQGQDGTAATKHAPIGSIDDLSQQHADSSSYRLHHFSAVARQAVDSGATSATVAICDSHPVQPPEPKRRLPGYDLTCDPIDSERSSFLHSPISLCILGSRNYADMTRSPSGHHRMVTKGTGDGMLLRARRLYPRSYLACL